MPTNMDTVTKEYYKRVKMTHTQQLESFGWCICEGGQGHISEGCPEGEQNEIYDTLDKKYGDD